MKAYTWEVGVLWIVGFCITFIELEIFTCLPETEVQPPEMSLCDILILLGKRDPVGTLFIHTEHGGVKNEKGNGESQCQCLKRYSVYHGQ